MPKGGAMTIQSNLQQFTEVETQTQFALQNAKLLKVDLNHGPVMAKLGSMVAYQGEASFKNKGSGGLGKMIKKAATGEGTSMMEVVGSGEVFLADQAADVQIMYLSDDSISVSGKNVLAYSASIESDVKRIGGGVAGAMAGGLYNAHLSGTGFVAITTEGAPVMLDVGSAPTFGDAQAVVMWSSGVQMQLKTDSGGMKSMIRGGTGETFQMGFSGQGFVLVQPSEGPPAVAGGGGGGGLLDALGG